MMRRPAAALFLAAFFIVPIAASHPSGIPVLGRWDVTVDGPHGTIPAWFDLEQEEHGLFVTFEGSFGAPEVIHEVAWGDDRLAFTSPFFGRFIGTWNGRFLTGTVRSNHPQPSPWRAERAPELKARAVTYARPETLFDGRTLNGWSAPGGGDHGWIVRDGALCNVNPSRDLVSLAQYRDFKLHIEYRTEPHGDSGIHLRGRYEVQVLDDSEGRAPAEGSNAVYGFLAPLAQAQRPTGEWNSLDVTLVGRTISATLNGQVIHDRAEIPGITGNALDSDERRPGPLMLQGYIGRVSYRNIVLTPAR